MQEINTPRNTHTHTHTTILIPSFWRTLTDVRYTQLLTHHHNPILTPTIKPLNSPLKLGEPAKISSFPKNVVTLLVEPVLWYSVFSNYTNTHRHTHWRFKVFSCIETLSLFYLLIFAILEGEITSMKNWRHCFISPLSVIWMAVVLQVLCEFCHRTCSLFPQCQWQIWVVADSVSLSRFTIHPQKLCESFHFVTACY